MSESRFVVLAALDASELAERIATDAAELAGARHGELHLLHVADPPQVNPADRALGLNSETLATGARQRLEAIAKRVGFPETVCHIAVGDATHEILQMASVLAADILVVGTHGRRGLERMLLGSVAEHVVRLASCPVLVARRTDYDAHVPTIEPPCPDCLETQRASGGKELWCALHNKHHPHGTLHYEYPQTFAVGSMLLRPNGGA